MNYSTNNVFAEISRSDDSVKTTLAVECTIRELVERGYMTMPKVSATPRGVAIYDRLRAQGFTPDREYARKYLQHRYGGDWQLLAQMVFTIWDEKIRDRGSQTCRDQSGGDKQIFAKIGG
jgi:hypothetical protein